MDRLPKTTRAAPRTKTKHRNTDSIRDFAETTSSLLLDEEAEPPPVIYLEDDEDDDAESLLDFELVEDEIKVDTARPRQHLDSHTLASGVKLRAGKCVELWDQNFLRIASIYRDTPTGEVLLKGILLRRHWRTSGMLERKVNEVHAVLVDVPRDVVNPDLNDHMVSIPESDVMCVRRVTFTNLPFAYRKFPDHSFRDAFAEAIDLYTTREHSILVCRWKLVEYISLPGRKPNKGALIRLRETESDPGKSMSDAALSYWWQMLEAFGAGPEGQPPQADTDASRRRRETKAANVERHEYMTKTTTKTSQSSSTFDPRHGLLKRKSVTMSEAEVRTSSALHTNATDLEQLGLLYCEPYTAGDICCGAGGVTAGAAKANFKMVFGVDFWQDACETIKLNFPSMKVLNVDIHDFLTKETNRKRYRVAVLHISFPCQAYSLANTWKGMAKNDERNVDSGYSAIPLLKKSRPRVMTLEQTSGLYTRHRQSFHALLMQLTHCHYSVGWEVVDCSEHRHVQARNRLICVGSCIGEPLPPIASPRHEHKTTIQDCLDNLPPLRSIPRHMQVYTERAGPSYDPNIQLRGAITCSGGEGDLHPTGKRGFRVQEFALLMGLPATYKFCQAGITALKRLIGNMVPMETAKDIFTEIKKSLKHGDQQMTVWLQGGEGKSKVKQELKEELGLQDSLRGQGKGKGKEKLVIVLDDYEDFMDLDVQPKKRKTKTGGLRQAPMKLEEADTIEID
ncbi:hypothetical protein LTR78_006946 [Recurvomyces mirabilis]|uniref:DNA (cytosine-5-)-methyltransferase n=1 Tax=Recurvomyces mirabilis TaxID=574656 RepID=A0AAE0WJY8_9PEZI|nr:hypothetical protein LTR78_006946 [Recurvomyces mirabilis]KAK5153330.1 hypothetical protein LTS14_007499 [Recurvomyces mirabilis]